MFSTYLQLGLDHILDINGYDHILFVLALCATFQVRQWRRVLVLVTAFTLGHSITLALAALDKVHFSSEVIEILIPITIILTGLANIVWKSNDAADFAKWKYLLPLGFGLIHGLGFSTYFRALMSSASEVVLPLFAFNVGVEVGQLVIVSLALLASYLVINVFKVRPMIWNYIVSGLAILVAGYLVIEKL